MTTNDNPVDTVQEQITQTQAGETPAPQYVTTDQFETLMKDVKQQGSLINRGLDSVRRDLSERMDKERETEAMAEIPSEYQDLMRPMVKQVTALTAELRNLKATQGQASSGANTGDDTLNAYLNGHGLTGNESGLDWDAYQNDNIQGFYASAAKLVAARGQSPASAPAPVVPQAPAAAPSPPVDGMPSGTSGDGGEDEALDMYISGQITSDEFHTRAGW